MAILLGNIKIEKYQFINICYHIYPDFLHHPKKNSFVKSNWPHMTSMLFQTTGNSTVCCSAGWGLQQSICQSSVLLALYDMIVGFSSQKSKIQKYSNVKNQSVAYLRSWKIQWPLLFTMLQQITVSLLTCETRVMSHRLFNEMEWSVSVLCQA